MEKITAVAIAVVLTVGIAIGALVYSYEIGGGYTDTCSISATPQAISPGGIATISVTLTSLNVGAGHYPWTSPETINLNYGYGSNSYLEYITTDGSFSTQISYETAGSYSLSATVLDANGDTASCTGPTIVVSAASNSTTTTTSVSESGSSSSANTTTTTSSSTTPSSPVTSFIDSTWVLILIVAVLGAGAFGAAVRTSKK